MMTSSGRRVQVMAFADEARRRNLAAIDEQVNRDLQAFLTLMDGFAEGFDADDLVDAVRYPRFDRRAATLRLRSLHHEGRIHRLAGRWHTGPLPAE
jgi:hypothetical protein